MIRVIPGARRAWRTLDPITWEIGKKGSGLWVTVPAGFEFESSVPRLCWWFFPPDDPRFLKAAAVHDWLLEASYAAAFAAGEWHSAAKSSGAPPVRRYLAFLAVAAWTVATKTAG